MAQQASTWLLMLPTGQAIHLRILPSTTTTLLRACILFTQVFKRCKRSSTTALLADAVLVSCSVAAKQAPYHDIPDCTQLQMSPCSFIS